MKEPLKYIDVHLHLQDKQLQSNLDSVISDAENAGIEYMFCNSGGCHDWFKVLGLAEKHENIVPFIGVHPWFVDQQPEDWEKQLLELAANHNCGIGETGLDRLLTKADFQLQLKVFTKQLQIAKQLNRPITIHCLSSYGHLLKILKSLNPIPQGSFIHSYSGSAEMITEFAKLGLMFSYNGKACDRKNLRYLKSIKATPLECLLVETDSPFMTPITADSPNLPSNLPQIAEQIAKIKNVSAQSLCNAAYSNAKRIASKITATSR